MKKTIENLMLSTKCFINQYNFMIIYSAMFFAFLFQSKEVFHEKMNNLENEQEQFLEQLEENKKQMEKIDELIENYHYLEYGDNSKSFSESLESYLGVTFNEKEKEKLDSLNNTKSFKYYLDENKKRVMFYPSNDTIRGLLDESEELLFDNIDRTNKEMKITKISYDSSKDEDYVVVSDDNEKTKYYEATDETIKNYIKANEYLKKNVLADEDLPFSKRQKRLEILKPVIDGIIDAEIKTILCDNILENNITDSVCETKVNNEAKLLLKKKKN